jgi:hypothetical protein
MAKRKRTNNYLQNTIKKTRNQATGTPLKTFKILKAPCPWLCCSFSKIGVHIPQTESHYFKYIMKEIIK